MSAKLTLIIPHLRTLLAHTGPASHLPEMVDFQNPRWVQRNNHLYHADGQLLSLLGLPENNDLPHAALFLHSDGSNRHHDAKFWHALVSPVHIEADKDGLILQQTHLALYSTESLQQKLQTAAMDVGLRYRPVDHPNAIGILSSDEDLEIRTTPLDSTPNRRIDNILPTGKHTDLLIRFMNDTQMILAHHNQIAQMSVYTDQTSGIQPNGLWAWGTGRLPESSCRVAKYLQVHSDQTGHRKLASHLGIKTDTIPHQLPEINPGSHVIVHIDPAEWARSNGDSAETLYMKLIANWLEPARRQAKKGVEIFLSPCDGYIYQYHPVRQSWWNKVLPFRHR